MVREGSIPSLEGEQLDASREAEAVEHADS
jgi:hypothetical protein